ncbi:unnamed protein product [Vicia faba]|uniref:Uncharacterized protein n=1 Tax=Vicia faba TaxID=3906 RepID=A0AAV0YW29_VICFA|nr:unnamed protein product [Vicia faba]
MWRIPYSTFSDQTKFSVVYFNWLLHCISAHHLSHGGVKFSSDSNGDNASMKHNSVASLRFLRKLRQNKEEIDDYRLLKLLDMVNEARLYKVDGSDESVVEEVD